MATISCGAKVFIVGEYVALSGGPTLLASIEPRFQLKITKGKGTQMGLSSAGPVALFLEKNKNFFSQWDLEFVDPFLGKGGFGASTAQVLSLLSLFSFSKFSESQSQPVFDYKELWTAYRSLHAGDRVLPSGADFMVQARGGILAFDRESGLLDNYIWPFPNLEMGIFPTGEKLPTHTHLKNLGEIDCSELEKIAAQTIQSMKEMNEEHFIEKVNQYHFELNRQKLVCDHTLKIIEELKQNPEVLAAKGCGALGFDSFLVITKKGGLRKLKGDLFQSPLVVPDQLTSGLSFEGDL